MQMHAGFGRHASAEAAGESDAYRAMSRKNLLLSHLLQGQAGLSLCRQEKHFVGVGSEAAAERVWNTGGSVPHARLWNECIL